MSPPGATRYFAFLRAINVGGRRLTNDELVRPFKELRLDDVAAYQAAGNITFRSAASEAVLTDALASALSATFGFDAPVFLRTRSELSAVVAAEPFNAAEIAQTDGRIQVAFMRAAPDAGTTAALAALVTAGDRIAFGGREWFWLPTRGISDSKLPIAAIEGLVGPMTIRTLGTVSRMLSRFG
jgi:uncharacterized protein (DUF1697 family)